MDKNELLNEEYRIDKKDCSRDFDAEPLVQMELHYQDDKHVGTVKVSDGDESAGEVIDVLMEGVSLSNEEYTKFMKKNSDTIEEAFQRFKTEEGSADHDDL